MRKVRINPLSTSKPGIYQFLPLEMLAPRWQEERSFLVAAGTEEELARIKDLQKNGLSNIFPINSEDLEAGDVVIVRPGRSEAIVAYRASDTHHSLFVTNRCNSYCLMCSQPPTRHDDSWLLDEAIEIVRNISESPRSLGITGGEPLLLGRRLRDLIDCIARHHPQTEIDLLTNGRLLADKEVANYMLYDLSANLSWMIPLYGPADVLHDYVVQSKGAFEETIGGLLRLQEAAQLVQLRIVLIKPVLEHLEELCNFIGRNLPFIREVALMGVEPIGFALANRTECELSLNDWQDTLVKATSALEQHRIPYVLMNIPLCGLPSALWPAAMRSISDWKNTYANECANCEVSKKCSGLFKWHEASWSPVKLRPIKIDGGI